MKNRTKGKVINIFAGLLLVLSMIFPGFAGAETTDDRQADTAAKINQDVMESFKKNNNVTYLVKFKEKADTQSAMKIALSKAEDQNLSAEEAETAKQEAVVSSLKETSKTSQEDVSDYLQTESEKGNATNINSFFIVNGLVVTSTREVAEKIASFDQVEKVLPNENRELITNKVNRVETNDETDSDIAWNVDRIGAPAIWDKDFDGSGAVVASIDSGAQWDHPALKEQYRGYDAETEEVDHDFSWYDAVTDESEPYDDVGHGTHVTGTMVGAEPDGSNQVGIAPGAEWISVKAFAEEGGSDADLLDAAEWVLLPTDEDGNERPDLRPDIVNNSWGGGPGMDEWYRDVVKEWRNADILPVFAAGNVDMYNPGGPESIENPANYPESFAVGATDEDDMIGSFSLRGPSPYDEVKPDIAAPGVGIYSTMPGDDYGDNNGTSMATPAVSGAAALLLSYDDSYTVDKIEELLKGTALPLTDDDYSDVPNNAYGHGLVDIFNAVSSSQEGLGTVEGQVVNEDGEEIEYQSTITVEETDRTIQTDKDGEFTLVHPVGEVTLLADAYGHLQGEQDVKIVKDETIDADFHLGEIPKGVLEGKITDEKTEDPVENATLLLKEDDEVESVTTNDEGNYSLEAYINDYTVSVTAPGYQDKETEVEIDSGKQELDLALKPYYTYPGDELAYDNGTIENGSMYYGGGAGWAVKMSLPDENDSAVVKEGKFAFIDKGFTDEPGSDFAVEVWDASGPEGTPGEKLAGPIDAEVNWEEEWTSVDLTEENIKVDEDFYMVYFQTMEYPDAPGLATDDGDPYNERSYQYTDGNFYPAFEEDGNYMIRTTVDYELETPEITDPKDGTETKDDHVSVSGTASPGTTINILNNDEKAGEVEVDDNGEFTIDVDLSMGENGLIASSVADDDPVVDSDKVTVTRAGDLTIDDIEPASNQYVSSGEDVEVSFKSETRGGDADFTVEFPNSKDVETNATGHMKEESPGFYKGTWTVPDNVTLDGAAISVTLSKDGKTEKDEASGKLFIYPEKTDRIAGDLRYDTAIETSKEGWDKADTVILTRGDEYADALAGVPLAHQLDAPILLTETDELWGATQDEMDRLDAEEVVILGGESAVSDNVKETLEEEGLDVRRIDGGDRFDTAALIAEEVAPDGTSEVAVANGMDFPDALSIASSAAQEGMPILLAKDDWISDKTEDTISDLGAEQAHVIGGTKVISDKIADELPGAYRLSGHDRYDTNIDVLEHFEATSEHTYVATGTDYADALTGAVLAAKKDSGILLVHNKVPEVTAKYITEQGIKHLTIFGGPVSIDEAVQKDLEDFLHE